MFCPNCGQPIEIKQSYCRGCGVDVLDFSRILIEQKENVETTEKYLWRKRLASFLLTAFAVLIFFFALTPLLLLPHPQAAIIILLTLLGFVGGIGGMLFFENRRLQNSLEKEVKKRRENIKVQANPQSQLNEVQSENRLLNELKFRPFSSVTENTTEFFTAEAVKRKTSGELG